MISNLYLLVFTIAFMGCVLAIPLVTQLAGALGAIDRPDQFRRVHKGAVPRMGGLGLAFGILAAMLVAAWNGASETVAWTDYDQWMLRASTILGAAILILGVGVIDDSVGMSPRVKLLGQGMCVLILYFGGIRVERFNLLGLDVDFTWANVAFQWGALQFDAGIPGLLLTSAWFLGCMNIWNLIDGMDGLASGVALLVSLTMMLVAMHLGNVGAALTSAALAGALAGFLLYNWHPACIFLGDCGSLLIGMLIGVIGVQGSMKGSVAASLLFPLLAMGLPISDTAMAIFRRWVRNLPLTVGDRKHVHHLLIGLGLDPRLAAMMLYCFSAFLCGAVLLGVAMDSEWLALLLALSGCLAFLLILFSRRDELTHLRADFSARMSRGRQERYAAKIAWEAIQRVELCPDPDRVGDILAEAARKLECRRLEFLCVSGDHVLLDVDAYLPPAEPASLRSDAESELGTAVRRAEDDHPRDARDPERFLAGELGIDAAAGPSLAFRHRVDSRLTIRLAVDRPEPARLAADIVHRFLRKLGEAVARRCAELRGIRVEPAEPGSSFGDSAITPPDNSGGSDSDSDSDSEIQPEPESSKPGVASDSGLHAAAVASTQPPPEQSVTVAANRG